MDEEIDDFVEEESIAPEEEKKDEAELSIVSTYDNMINSQATEGTWDTDSE